MTGQLALQMRADEGGRDHFKACRQISVLKSQIPGIICSEELSYLLFDYCCLLIVHLLISRNESVKGVQALSIQFEGLLLVCLFMVLDL